MRSEEDFFCANLLAFVDKRYFQNYWGDTKQYGERSCGFEFKDLGLPLSGSFHFVVLWKSSFCRPQFLRLQCRLENASQSMGISLLCREITARGVGVETCCRGLTYCHEFLVSVSQATVGKGDKRPPVGGIYICARRN